ncbi:hypothetical protein [Arthrobacter sp. U41]|uniref:hypothetical protein n=1 Tax=Arthrobacter sp. U41 TaxID=1849032 RepID=UPI000859613A|nr:hypothetical protein [Arthrobacter sp. U41]AOT05813.1 hypothetical protein ASPU41_20480 [Arthrobacter sp. U41]
MMEQQVLADFCEEHELRGVDWSAPVPQVPSPSWWASDSSLYQGSTLEHVPVMAKVVSRFSWSWRNKDNLIRAAVAAGNAGIGPRVHVADPQRGILLMERMPPEWRVGRLDLLRLPQVRANLIKARQDFANLDLDLSPRSAFVDLDHLQQECADRRITLDQRLTDAIDRVETFRRPLLAHQNCSRFVPSHGEGTISNVLVGPNHQIKLIGWGSAAALSKAHDAALLMSEACPTVLSEEELFEELMPHGTESDYAAAALLQVLEHLRWALLISLRAATDDTAAGLDSTKYGLWRMTLAEIRLMDDQRTARLLEGLS